MKFHIPSFRPKRRIIEIAKATTHDGRTIAVEVTPRRLSLKEQYEQGVITAEQFGEGMLDLRLQVERHLALPLETDADLKPICSFIPNKEKCLKGCYPNLVHTKLVPGGTIFGLLFNVYESGFPRRFFHNQHISVFFQMGDHDVNIL